MKKKKGFTLVELLAVIVILAVILVIAIPQIMNTIKQARLSSIRDSAILIVTTAEKDYLSEQILNKDYSVTSIPCTDVAKLNDDYDSCTITYNNGVATVKLKGAANGKFNGITCSGTKDNMICGEKTSKACTAEGTLAQGLEYVDGQYTYRYMQEYAGSSWSNISNDGWGVILTDKESTNPVTTELCTTINGKPIVSMKSMFLRSAATSIDLSSFDTSNVTNMNGMFANSTIPILNLSSFDTSNVIDMSGMFYYSNATSIIFPSEWKTGDNATMGSMFSGITATNLDLSSFDTSKVTDMYYMFYESKATSLDLSSFDTSKVTNMGVMFGGSKATSLDLSSFDTSNVTNMGGMFYNSAATTVYARNNDEITRLSNSGGVPSTLTFAVKN